MTKDEKIETLRVLLGDENDDSDVVLSTYLDIAGRKIINRAFPYDSDVVEVPMRYEYLQIDIAVYLLNKRGAEGETHHDENGTSRDYENADVPVSMLSEIVPHCGTIK